MTMPSLDQGHVMTMWLAGCVPLGLIGFQETGGPPWGSGRSSATDGSPGRSVWYSSWRRGGSCRLLIQNRKLDCKTSSQMTP